MVAIATRVHATRVYFQAHDDDKRAPDDDYYVKLFGVMEAFSGEVDDDFVRKYLEDELPIGSLAHLHLMVNPMHEGGVCSPMHANWLHMLAAVKSKWDRREWTWWRAAATPEEQEANRVKEVERDARRALVMTLLMQEFGGIQAALKARIVPRMESA